MSAGSLRRVRVSPTLAAPYQVAFDFVSEFGRCVGVHLAEAQAADAVALRASLHPSERPLTNAMRGLRLVEFVGGRLAARLAGAGFGGDDPIRIGAGGIPVPPCGRSLSISHNRCYAVALVRVGVMPNVGIDIEALDEVGSADLLQERILSKPELAMPADGTPLEILRRFSLKEAAYKALFPKHGHVPLRQITVLPRDSNDPGFQLVATERRIHVRAASQDFDGHVLSLAIVL